MKVAATMLRQGAVPAPRRVADAILGIGDPLLALLRDVLHLVDTPQMPIWIKGRIKGYKRSSDGFIMIYHVLA